MPSFRVEIREARQYADVIEASSEADARALALALARDGELMPDTLDRDVTVIQIISSS